MKKFLLRVLFSLMLLVSVFSAGALAAEDSDDIKTVTLLFTHDIHEYYESVETYEDGEKRWHGGAARLATLLEEEMDDHTVYVDAGDFSMGTLLQADYSTNGYELRTLGRLGCLVTTFGNHDFDFGAEGISSMLEAAASSGDPLPAIVTSNLDFSGELTEEQELFRQALEDYGASEYIIKEIGGVKVAFFGLLGENAVEDAPTSGQKWEDIITAAKRVVAEIGDQADVIVCLSHSGTDGNGETGEDIDLMKAVPEIDAVISAHSHTVYSDGVYVNDRILGSSGCYLYYLGKITLQIDSEGVHCTDYELIPINDTIEEDAAMEEYVSEWKRDVETTYLAEEGISYDQVLCHCDFDFMSLNEMYATHQEYPLGDLIADSYLYEAEQNGIQDIDVAIVGLGTIRSTLMEGDVTTANAFEVCSLGVGTDGSAGHALIACYISGKELKLLAELDASLGTMVESIKMSYSGLSFTYNTKRMLLDRVTDIYLTREDGTREEIEDDKLYKVCCNQYAANMLGMVNSLTKGILSITPKDADGNTVENLADYSLVRADGSEIKEWVAFKDLLVSFGGEDGTGSIPASYREAQGRKVKVSEGGLAVIKNPGLTTGIVMGAGALLVLLLIFIVRIILKKIRGVNGDGSV